MTKTKEQETTGPGSKKRMQFLILGKNLQKRRTLKTPRGSISHALTPYSVSRIIRVHLTPFYIVTPQPKSKPSLKVRPSFHEMEVFLLDCERRVKEVGRLSKGWRGGISNFSIEETDQTSVTLLQYPLSCTASKQASSKQHLSYTNDACVGEGTYAIGGRCGAP